MALHRADEPDMSVEKRSADPPLVSNEFYYVVLDWLSRARPHGEQAFV